MMTCTITYLYLTNEFVTLIMKKNEERWESFLKTKKEKTEKKGDKYCVRHLCMTSLLLTDKKATAWSVRDRLALIERSKV